MKNFRTLTRRRRGFSMVEVLIGFVILLIAMASASALSITNTKLALRNQFRLYAANLAEAKLEQLRNTTYASIVTGSDATTLTSFGAPNGSFTRSWAVTPNSPVNGLKLVVVQVSWTETGGTQTYSVSGEIGQ